MPLSVEQLKQDLEKSYELLVFKDLAAITESPADVYKILNSVRRDHYDPNQRLVFYSCYDVDLQLKNHINRCLEDLDISEFFLVLAKTSHSLPLSSGFNVPDTMCPLPWMHLEIKHNGNISPCCVSTDVVAVAEDSDLNQVIHNKKMQQLREDFLAGKKPKGCDHCWTLEHANQQSNRQWHLDHYRQKFYLNYFDDIRIRSLDLKPGNACNFKCRICNPTNSSLFADEQLSYQKIAVKSDQARWNEYNQYTWQQLEQLLPTLENIDFYGGEPFLIKEIPRLLELAVKQQFNNKIRLHFNSNGSIWPDQLIPVLQSFRQVDIAFSIDNIGTRFELERGGSWPEVEKNILRFVALNSKQFNCYIMPTLNIQNCLYVNELLDWADCYQIKVALNYLDRPKWANIDYMTLSAKQLVVEKFSNSSRPELQYLAQRVATSPGSDGLDFCKNMQRFDSIRKQNFRITHSEIAKAMGYSIDL